MYISKYDTLIIIDEEEDDDGRPKYDMIVTGPEQLGILQDLTHSLNIPGTTSLTYIPKERLVVPDYVRAANMELIHDFLDIDDVDDVLHNMQL